MASNNISNAPQNSWNLSDSASTGFALEELWTFEILYLVHNHWHISLYIAVCYIVVIFGLQRWMQSRKAFRLKFQLFLWNLSFAIFSTCGFLRTMPELTYILSNENGLFRSICVREPLHPIHVFWGFLFAMSKVVELGDTVFIVLRKRPLIFLQWYHHLTAMLLVAYTGRFLEPFVAWAVVLNYGVHSVMYFYFALKTIGVYVPVVVAKIITTFQLAQMIVVVFLNMTTIYWKEFGGGCFRESSSIAAFGFVYGSFAVLFGKLFYKSVVIRKLSYKRD